MVRLDRKRQAGAAKRRAHAIGAAVVGVLAAASLLSSGLIEMPGAAQAAGTNCPSGSVAKCVILIQINGLEPKDVTRQNTPFLWALAHSGDATDAQLINQYPALASRNGWAWQAARGVMSTGDGPSTEALLTGDTAEQSGLPADLFAKPVSGSTGLSYYQTGGGPAIPDASCGSSADPCDSVDANIDGNTLLSAAVGNNDTVGLWLGDPRLCTLVNNGLGADPGLLFDEAPGAPSGNALSDVSSGGAPTCPGLWSSAPPASYTGESPYCPSPLEWPNVQGTQYYPAVCPTTDAAVLSAAEQDMATKKFPDLSFVYLADVGLAKQRAGDLDCFAELGCGGSNPTTGAPNAPPAVSTALQTTDTSLAAFVSGLFEQLSQSSPASWQNTYIMVVGSHGYEATPTPLRVPDPDTLGGAGANPTCAGAGGSPPTQTGPGDLACWVAQAGGTTDGQPNAVLVPQGTLATIYYQGPNDPATEAGTFNKLYAGLCGSTPGQCSTTSAVNAGCETLLAQSQQSGQLPSTSTPFVKPNCIEAAYYVDPSWIPASQAGQYPASEFLFGAPGDVGYATSANPFYNPNPDCQSTDPGGLFYDATDNCDPNLRTFYRNEQASWHLDALNPVTVHPDPKNPSTQNTYFTPSGAGGQMVIEMEPGWAAGALPGVTQTPPGGGPVGQAGYAADPVDPYLASAGGPRDRAIAAIVNGPDAGTDAVVQYPDSLSASGVSGDGLAPVTLYDIKPSDTFPRDGDQPFVCSKDFLAQHAEFQDNPSAGTLAVDEANAAPGNDSAALGSPVFNSQADSYVPIGYECQAQIVDFAPTIEALENIPSSGTSSDARFLDEAFTQCIGGQQAGKPSGPICGTADTTGNSAPPPHIVPPPIIQLPPQIIYTYPPPPPAYAFSGLVRNVQAQVVDQNNDTVPDASPGTYLSSIRITGDFGKPLSQVTITLYRLAARASSSARKGPAGTQLTAIGRFCPFTVTRAPNVQLRFAVPTLYQPKYVGLAVRQVRKLSAATGPGCGQAQHNAFVAFGPIKGAVVPILNAQLLHKLKPCPTSLSISLPHGPGVNVETVTISRGGRTLRTLHAWQLKGTRVVIPAAALPGGELQIRTVWLKLDRIRLVTNTSATVFQNCTAAQRRTLGEN